MSDLRHGVIDINSAKHLKKIKQIINACSMATKCWDRCMSEEEKKGIEANFTDKN